MGTAGGSELSIKLSGPELSRLNNESLKTDIGVLVAALVSLVHEMMGLERSLSETRSSARSPERYVLITTASLRQKAVCWALTKFSLASISVGHE
jgi:hypothetical protein